MKPQGFRILSLLLVALVVVNQSIAEAHAQQTGLSTYFNQARQLSRDWATRIASTDFANGACLSDSDVRLFRESASRLTLAPAKASDKGAQKSSAKPLANTMSASSETLKNAVYSVFRTRLFLRSKITAQTSETCVSTIEDLMFNMRLFEENLVAMSVPQKPAITRGGRMIFTGSSPELVVNPKFESAELRNGDLVVVDQNDVASAGEATVTQDSAFGHLAIVYIPQGSKTPYLVDTMAANAGVIIHPAAEEFKDRQVRAELYRFRDPVVAAKVANDFAQRVRDLAAKGEQIGYDWTFHINNYKKMYCAGTAYEAYKTSTRGEVILPMHESRYLPGALISLARGGVKNPARFMPTAIETDARFDLVASWRDPSQVAATHLIESVARNVWGWADLGYRVHSTIDSVGVKYLAWSARQLPIVGEVLLGGMMANSIPQNSLETYYGLAQVASIVRAEISKLPPTLDEDELAHRVEDLRVHDEAAFLASMRTPVSIDDRSDVARPVSKFHGYYNRGDIRRADRLKEPSPISLSEYD